MAVALMNTAGLNPAKPEPNMKQIKLWTTLACLAAFLGSATLLQAETCCEKAKAAGKECSHKCCVKAAKEGKACEMCKPKKEDKK